MNTLPGPHSSPTSARRSLRPRLDALLLLIVGGGLVGACGTSGGTSEPAAMASGGAVHDETSPPAPGARRIEVTARSFGFEPDEITVTAGEDLAIVLTSKDSLHDFTIDELDGHVAAEAGETKIGGVRAEKPGRYMFYCSVPGHRAAGMNGVLVVQA